MCQYEISTLKWWFSWLCSLKSFVGNRPQLSAPFFYLTPTGMGRSPSRLRKQINDYWFVKLKRFFQDFHKLCQNLSMDQVECSESTKLEILSNTSIIRYIIIDILCLPYDITWKPTFLGRGSICAIWYIRGWAAGLQRVLQHDESEVKAKTRNEDFKTIFL